MVLFHNTPDVFNEKSKYKLIYFKAVLCNKKKRGDNVAVFVKA